MWASAIALLSMQTMAWVAGGLAVLGGGILATEYLQSRRARTNVITEVNFAGQHVEGTRADLYRLHQAQVRIMNLASSFQQASSESTSETVARIAESVAQETKRVKVVSGGRYGAGTDAYEFSEPGIKLVKDRPQQPATVVPTAAPAVADKSLKAAWDHKGFSEEEIVDRLTALQQALPPEVLAKVEERMAEQRAAQQKPAAQQPSVH